jgi:hypothetical protein
MFNLTLSFPVLDTHSADNWMSILRSSYVRRRPFIGYVGENEIYFRRFPTSVQHEKSPENMRKRAYPTWRIAHCRRHSYTRSEWLLDICQSNSLVYLFNGRSEGDSPGLPEVTQYSNSAPCNNEDQPRYAGAGYLSPIYRVYVSRPSEIFELARPSPPPAHLLYNQPI